MNRVYTDCPEQLKDFFSDEPDWQAYNHNDLDEADAALWQALEGTPTLWAADLSLQGLSRLVIVEKAQESQYDALLKLINAGGVIPDGTAALALEGEGFHGRFSRPWQAVRGNLHLSIYQQMQAPVQQMAAGLSMLPAVAALEAILASCGPDCGAGIKWVNDVVMQGCKVAGVLTASQSKGSILEHVVCGIGVNVENTPDISPTPFVPRAGSLRTVGPDPALKMADVFWHLQRTWNARFEELRTQGPNPLLEAYRKHSIIVGQPVRIWDEDTSDQPENLQTSCPLAEGTVLSIEADLSLTLSGVSEPVSRGRLALESACREYGLS